MWEHFHHQADIGVRGTGTTVEQAFAEAAVALTAVMCSVEKVKPDTKIEIRCDNTSSDGLELLLVDWLNAVIYQTDTRKMFFSRFEVKIGNGSLRGSAWGEPIDNQKHQTAVEVKAATYMMLKVARRPDGTWLAQCVVDV